MRRVPWWGLLALGVVALGLVWQMNAGREESGATGMEALRRSVVWAEQLRQSSDELSLMMRLYAATGEEVYTAQFDEILAIRNGEAVRVAPPGAVYRDLVIGGLEPAVCATCDEVLGLRAALDREGISAEERQLLERAQAESDALVALEAEVRAQVAEEGPTLAAVQRLSGTEYLAAKARIMEPVGAFRAAFDARVADELAAEQARESLEGTIRGVLVALGVMLVLAGLGRRRAGRGA